MLWKDFLEGRGWQQNLRSPHRLCIPLAAVFLSPGLQWGAVTFALEYFFVALLNFWRGFPLSVPSSLDFHSVCMDTNTLRAATKDLSTFARLLRNSVLPCLTSMAQAWEGWALCLPFLAPVRLLKLIYWAAHLFQNSHERDILWGLHLPLRPENFCTK